MSEDEEWTPPTEAELKVFSTCNTVCPLYSHFLGCFSVYWNTDTHRSHQLYQCMLKHRQTQRLHQVLAARRERSDKISKLMGDYMLKVNCVYPRRSSEFISSQGYRMLATLCPICECVELQDRQGAKYCVACQEVIITFASWDPLLLCLGSFVTSQQVNSDRYFLHQVDCHETSKDNPALSQQAASGVRAFYNLFVIVKIRQMFSITI